MNLTETLDDNYSSGAALTPEIKGYLQETAKWAKFIAIVGFVFVGLIVIIALFMGAFLSYMTSDFGGSAMPFPPAIFSGIYLILAILLFFPSLYLFRFANLMQASLKNGNDISLSESFKNLKGYFKFYGIMTAIIIGIYALMFILGIFIGGAGLMM